MDVLVIDCERICVTDISKIAGDSLVLCSANTLTKLPICHGERVGCVAPKIPYGTDYLLISMLTKSLVTNKGIEHVEAVTKDAPFGCMIQYLCNVNDVDCHISKSLADVGLCSMQAPSINEREYQHLKRTIYNLFIARKLLTLCAISTCLSAGPRAVKQAVDELTAEKKIRHEQGQLWRLLD